MADVKTELATGLNPSQSISAWSQVNEKIWTLQHLMKTSLVALLPGAAQGATTIVLGHPLDTTKVRMQAFGPHTSRSTVGTMWRMATSEGPRSLYRGVTPPLLMEGVKRSLQFALWDWMRAFATNESVSRNASGSAFSGATGDAWSDVHHFVHRGLVEISSSSFISGAIVGGFGTLIGCPMHVLKIQTQYQTAMDTRNAWTCMRSIYDREGFLGFYRGFRYNLVKDFCFSGTYLGLYATLRDRPFFKLPSATTASETTSTTTSPFQNARATAFLSGAIASMVTWALLFPLDTIKTLVQAQQAHAIRPMLRQPFLFYRGLTASLVKAGPVSGAAMAVYEQTRALVNR
ncbi:hypothetical protein JKF63_06919 [Porcisia hertigi]|uniref:Mitochondrial carrier protein n=1 Tax=Porcisia hertigi TaxID=2761500 RepID=A0A836LJE2_9TRYP|nr:hypothetical protein JKF63_06919 [Porcisia hertigi]